MTRIAVGGWQHETNTFAPLKADLFAFEQADEWPHMAHGQKMLHAIDGVHLPITGALDVLKDAEHEVVPLLWCSATPSAHVTQNAFEAISGQLLDLIKSALPLDGLYLDLHGAMVCEHVEDGEGEFLRLVRDLVGPDLPIAVSLDLHANITPLMVEKANYLDVFRTYPHIDMGETGARTMRGLLDMMENQTPYVAAFRQFDFLVPLNSGCSLIEPCQSIYDSLPQRIDGGVHAISFACGFHLSDIYDVGPSVLAYAQDQQTADKAVDALFDYVGSRRSVFYETIWSIEDALVEAKRISLESDMPVILADTQDNPGGGGPGDTTGLLQAIIATQVERVLLGTVSDPQVTTMAHEVGVGGEISIALGGKSGAEGHSPFHCTATVIALSDGNFTATGPMYLGANMQLGLCALLDICGVHVLISSKAAQTSDQSFFRHIGVDPDRYDIVSVKSSVHFRNHFTDMASAILVVAAPGPVYADPASLSYLRPRKSLDLS